MRMRWRFGLLAIIAAAVLGGTMAHGVLSGAQSATTDMVQVVEAPVSSMPLLCMDAICGKGSPAPAAPAPALALAAVVAGFAVIAATASAIRRRRTAVIALPAGSRDLLFRPPRSS
jgi:hypothetical protein